MGSKQRQTQNRPRRETEAKEKAQLKQENGALKKQVTRLRRELQKVLDSQSLVQAEAEEKSDTTLGGGKEPTCIDCGSAKIVVIAIPTGSLVVCEACGSRKKK